MKLVVVPAKLACSSDHSARMASMASSVRRHGRKGNPQGLELLLQPADTCPEDHPSARQVVQRGQFLGQHQGVAQGTIMMPVPSRSVEVPAAT